MFCSGISSFSQEIAYQRSPNIFITSDVNFDMVKVERVEFDEKISPLSPLEEKIMEFLWKHGPSHVALIAEEIGASLSSVAATLDRLVKNGLVERKQEKIDGRRKFVFYPVVSRNELERRFVENVLDRLVENFGEVVVEYFHRKGIRK